MSDIEWKEPPGAKGSLENREFADALRANPRRWAVYRKDMGAGSAAARAKQIRNGDGFAAPAGSFDAVSRKAASGEPGKSDIYVRFVGDGGAADAAR